MNLATHWNSELQQRYASTEAAHSCYPSPATVPQGLADFDTLRALRNSRQALKPLSLYIHLPFCASRCHHCQRQTTALDEPAKLEKYLQSLEQEFALISCHLDRRQQVERLHLGGGTPVLLNHTQLQTLTDSLKRHFSLLGNRGDYSIEIDPRRTDWPTIGLLRELGFNRIQLRVHDLAEPVQQAINRRPTLKEIRGLIEAARTLAFKSIDAELMYGLPEQSAQSFAATLEKIIALAPDRLSLKPFNYQPERFNTQQRLDASRLPTPDELLSLREQSLQLLLNAGYLHLGLEHFVQPYDDLLMAQDNGNLRFDLNGYSHHSPCDQIGFGLGAISHISGVYSRNSDTLSHYSEQLNAQRLPRIQSYQSSPDDQVRSFVIEQLTCQHSLDFKQLEQRFDIHFQSYFASILGTLEQMAQENILYLGAEELRISATGRHLLAPLRRLFDKH